jgi:hypothetical protein
LLKRAEGKVSSNLLETEDNIWNPEEAQVSLSLCLKTKVEALLSKQIAEFSENIEDTGVFHQAV